MPHVRRIMAATDLSAYARQAAERAAVLSGQSGAALDLVIVLDTSLLQPVLRFLKDLPPDLEQPAGAVASGELRDLAEYLEAAYGVSAGARVRAGALLPELVTQMRELAADLVVVGGRGGSRTREALLGTTAERLLRVAPRPVLVVRQPARGPYRRVLVPVDLSSASRGAVDAALAVAPDARMILLHAFQVPFEGLLQYAGVDEAPFGRYRAAAEQEALAGLRELAAAAGLAPGRSTFLVRHGVPSLRIMEQAGQQGCDLIAVGKHGQDRWEEVLLGSTTKQILRRSRIDVLMSVS